ncbi:hypothetical protein [Olleya sp. Bg11-27]|uniref:hypothetical protein n=1 Tax=Olleya sp. Bg11-27 TaxID=2058135 RepID=UPI000C308C85|nr:hypothetical protein [Olleya sp. Bg11-27]AUC75609.1 hypothetical protein CW732_07960 [Olleya sp. Bg11-27]
MSKKKILVISPRAFGYVEYLYQELKRRENVEVNIAYLEFTGFKNPYEKVQNVLSKAFLGVNLKKAYYFMQDDIRAYGKQDEILIIRPDLLTNKFLKELKTMTTRLVAYYWDSAQRLTRKQDIIPFFDKIFSFDKIDVKKYGFDFITNYIFETDVLDENPKYLFFNISGNDDDYRFKQLVDLGSYIKSKDWSFKFISVHPKLENISGGTVEVVDKVIYVNQAIELAKKAKIIVEFQRKDQTGLTFRVFEALGLQKKLITTNRDVMDFDFYNPQNILVIDENNIEIPEDFVNSPYVEVQEEILEQYRLKNWVNTVFNLK